MCFFFSLSSNVFLSHVYLFLFTTVIPSSTLRPLIRVQCVFAGEVRGWIYRGMWIRRQLCLCFFLSPVLEVRGRKGPLIQIGSRKYPLLHDLRHMTWEIRNWKYGSEEPFMVL